jgi:hypothetical protein
MAETEIDPQIEKQARKLEIQRQGQKILQKGFLASFRDRQEWLALPKLIDRYQTSGSMALQRFDFRMWQEGLAMDWEFQERQLTEWGDKTWDFFDYSRPIKFRMQWPMEPEVSFPASQPTTDDSGDSVAPVAIATGLGWVFGGPVGAAVLGAGSYLLNKTRNPLEIGVDETRLSRVQQAYDLAIQNYLTQLSTMGLAAIAQYEKDLRSTLFGELVVPTVEPGPENYRIALVRQMLEKLEEG